VLLAAAGSAGLVVGRRRRPADVAETSPAGASTNPLDVPIRFDRPSDVGDPLLQAIYQSAHRSPSPVPASEPAPAWVQHLRPDIDRPVPPTLRVLPDADQNVGVEEPDESPAGRFGLPTGQGRHSA
jgi:hypothetical protein